MSAASLENLLACAGVHIQELETFESDLQQGRVPALSLDVQIRMMRVLFKANPEKFSQLLECLQENLMLKADGDCQDVWYALISEGWIPLYHARSLKFWGWSWQYVVPRACCAYGFWSQCFEYYLMGDAWKLLLCRQWSPSHHQLYQKLQARWHFWHAYAPFFREQGAGYACYFLEGPCSLRLHPEDIHSYHLGFWKNLKKKLHAFDVQGHQVCTVAMEILQDQASSLPRYLGFWAPEIKHAVLLWVRDYLKQQLASWVRSHIAFGEFSWSVQVRVFEMRARARALGVESLMHQDFLDFTRMIGESKFIFIYQCLDRSRYHGPRTLCEVLLRQQHWIGEDDVSENQRVLESSA